MAMCKSLVKEMDDTISQYKSNNNNDSSSCSSNNDADWKDMKICINNLGLDIDPILIKRTNLKNSSTGNITITGVDPPTHRRLDTNYEFQVCDVSNMLQHQACYESFLPSNSTNNTIRFDLTTVFSTTMWIHLHSGDEGLANFIERVCKHTTLLLIEPQPSKW